MNSANKHLVFKHIMDWVGDGQDHDRRLTAYETINVDALRSLGPKDQILGVIAAAMVMREGSKRGAQLMRELVKE